MMKIITLCAIVACATALPTTDEVVPEIELVQASEAYNSAKAEVDQLIQSGKDEGACADLAAATIKEVEDAVNNQQEILKSLDKGTSCPNEGQAEVDAAQGHLDKANKANSDAQAALAAALAAPVKVDDMPYESLTEGQCDFYFNSASFISAKTNAEAAKKAATEAAAAASAASTALEAAIEQQKKDILACQCKVKEDYAAAWKTANANNDENAKTYTKGKHMQCVLAGTDYASCDAGEAPKVSQVALADGVEDAECHSYEHVSYIGCYGDNGARDLKHGPKNYGFSATNCRRHCKNYKYFALQNGGWCNCDNSYGDGYSGSGGKGNYNKYPDSQCNTGGVTPGRGMGGGWLNAIYESKPSSDAVRLTADDMVNWVGSCSATKISEDDKDRFSTGDKFRCGSGSNQMRTKKVYTAPLTFSLEMYQSDSAGDECGVFSVFGAVNNRHAGLSAGRGWWAHYLGYGYNNAQGNGINGNKDGETKRWTQMTASVASNGVATFWVEGQKYATVSSGWNSASGYLTIGMNCRGYDYQNLVVQEGVSW